MKIRIIEKAGSAFIKDAYKGLHPAAVAHYDRDYVAMLDACSGMILKVETEYLFKNQFNTAPIEGISKLGLRVMEKFVAEVIDDERPGKARCNWCGKTSATLDKCQHCEKSEYLEVF
jgi:hypothetical protein